MIFATFIVPTDSLAFGSGKSSVTRNYNPSYSSRSGTIKQSTVASSSSSNHPKISTIATADSNKNCDTSEQHNVLPSSRRKILKSSLLATLAAVTLTTLTPPPPANARYVLDEQGEYIELQEEDWKTAWKARLDKAQSMSKDEIFEAARGAGNLELKEGGESDAARKRRAMSACRDKDIRGNLGGGGIDLKVCNNRVMAGETDFILPPPLAVVESAVVESSASAVVESSVSAVVESSASAVVESSAVVE